ncbi:MAG: YggT family protein [Vicinamibacteria bacterium]
MNPQKVEADEQRRIAQHERVKSELEEDVHARITREAKATPSDQAEVASVASNLRHNAAVEVRESERELGRARKATRASQVVDYAFYLVYGLVGLEIVLELLGARQGSGFKQFMDAVTWPLLAPFRGLMPTPSVGSSQLMLSYVIALGVYILLHLAVNGALRMMAERKAQI